MPPLQLTDVFKSVIDRAPETYERNLIMALIHSQSFYFDVKDQLCPWDEARATRRQDFSVSRYNQLYEAIAFFWNLFGARPFPRPIPQQHLRSIVIDWNNTGKINTTVAQELVQEIDEDLYAIPTTKEFIDGAIAGSNFTYWLRMRLDKRVMADLLNRSKSMIVTVDNLKEVIQQFERDAPAENNKNVFGGDVLRSKIRLAPKLSSSLPGLDNAIGGGFGLGEGTMIAGTNAAGKTVLACQLASDFITAGRKVVLATTEQRPEEIICRIVSNRLQIDYSRFTQRRDNTLAPGEKPVDKEVAAIPDDIWNDANYSTKLEALKVDLNKNLLFLDWSDGTRKSVAKNFDAEIADIVQKGFDPEMIIFDWVGGGLENRPDIERRLLYDETANHLINHAKQFKRGVIVMAQLDRTKAMGKLRCGSGMLSECKTMPNNFTNFVGISAMLEKGAEGVYSIPQSLYVEKARNGLGGLVPVERHFQFQRFYPKSKMITIQGGQ